MLDAELVKNSVSYYFQTHDYNPALVFSGLLDVLGLAGSGARFFESWSVQVIICFPN